MICYSCRDKGMINGCPKCGKKLALGNKGNVVVTEELLETNAIPKEYIDIQWDIDELKSSHGFINDAKFNNYCDQLTKIYNVFNSGLLPQQSAIVIAGRGMGKMTFAYMCMKSALSNGYSVCPVLDNTQIKRINELSADKPKSWNMYKLPSIEEIINSDVLFITIDIDNYSSALRTIESVMLKRARVGRSTIILSRYSLDSMSMFDKKNSYMTLVDNTRSYNNKKYPVIISCL